MTISDAAATISVVVVVVSVVVVVAPVTEILTDSDKDVVPTVARTFTVPPLVPGSTILADATPLLFVAAIESKTAPPLAPLSANWTATPWTPLPVPPRTVTERFTVAAGLPVRVDGESVRVGLLVSSVGCVTVIVPVLDP
jgi:hypothetical protein